MNGSGRPVGVHGATEVAFYIDDTHSMSERVQSLADAVYKEFERLIKAYDENVVKDLMPLVVAILEGLESSCREKQQADVDAELLRDDNDQLLAQYEKERQLRRIADQKYLALEDSMEEERKQLQGRLESFESIVRMFEIKLKNSQDQVVRMDEKEQETKKEFSKLHERYTDLLKAHMDFKERVKTLVSGNPASQEVIDQSNLSSDLTLPRNFKFPNLASKQNRSEFSDVESSSEMSSPVKSRTIVYTKDDYDDDDDGDDNDGEHGYANKSIGFEINNAINSEEDQSAGPKRLISIDEHLRKSLIGEMDKLHLTFCEEDGNYESLIRPGVYDDMENDERSELALGDPSKAEEEQDLRQEDDDDDEGGDDNDCSDADQYNFYGVSKEIENLIMENNELLETKHALNIVKDDLIAKVDELTGEKEILKDELNTAVQSKERIKSRVAELEEELKRMREELDKERNKDSGSNHGDGEEDGLPPGQRKRFTRLEMARVLMERNQYKERLMELQEAVRWAEMVRAARDHPEFGGEKKKSSIWNFFSNLFSTGRSNSSFADHSTPGDHSSFLTPNSDQRSIGLNSILDRRRRTEERSMATPTGPSKLHPPQEESRLVACGWSLPPKFQLNRTLNFDSGSSSSLPNSVPLPIFCKPLLEEDPNIKILCAAAITWKGGRTKDGGNVVGTSVFYPNHADPLGATRAGRHGDDEIEKLNEEILSREKEIKDVNDFPLGCGGNDPDPYHVWVCVDDRTGSHVIVVDAGNEGEVLEKFHVCLPNLHCITGVPGATEDCYTNKDNSSSSSSSSSPQTSLPGHVTFVQLHDSDDLGVGVTGDPQGSRPLVDPAEEEVERSLNLQPTVWMGNIAGSLYVYSADPGSRKRLHVVKLGDSIMNICHLRGRVFVALANGTVACFSRASDGQWNVRSHYIIELAQPTYAVRSAAVVAKKFLWCSVANDIFVIDPVTFVIGDKFNAHPRKENHVRHMAWMGEGVWVGFRNDSSLRLYHAYTHQYLQDVDIEPCVSKFLGSSKLGFSLVQISCLMTSQDRLWIGTGNGVVINIPISECTNGSSVSTPVSIGGHKAPGGVVRVYGDKKNEEIYPGSFIPYCSLSQVQLSFHGLKEVVKFIIAMPGNEKKIPTTKIGEKHAEIYRKYSLPLPSSTSLTLSQSQSSTAIGELTPEPAGQAKCLWIMCGGEGCSDFRLGEDMSSAVDRDDIEHSDSTGDTRMEDVGVIDLLPKSDKSHIIMWQLLVP